jgi:HEAT repeat protein
MNAALAQIESALAQNSPPDSEHLELLAQQLWRRDPRSASTLQPSDVDRIVQLYHRLDPQSALRHHLLRALAVDASQPALAAFAELFAQHPPARAEDAALACVPLLQRPTPRMAALFPRLLDALEHPAAAPLVLDIANHFAQRGILAEHPGRPRVKELIDLLGGLVEGLRRLEEDPRQLAASPAELQRRIADSVALVAPLCEALAQIGDPAAIGKLSQVLSLGHRRLRVVAAHALARLGEASGVEALVQLAAAPVVRSLAIEYLTQLGEAERVDPRLRSPAARAEGELAAWLAHPARFGLPPAELELIEAACRLWPGYEEPLECFLFRFEYHLPQGDFSGVGIAGPVTHAFYADLEDLSPEDIFALYAGWSAEHEEISETPADSLDAQQRADWESLRQQCENEGYSDVRLAKLGHFFGDDIFVASAAKCGQSGVLIVESGSIHWFPTIPSSRPLGCEEVYWLFIGRRLMSAFNRR